jgi:eukaryotic-like serine/threonine-protein kinase
MSQRVLNDRYEIEAPLGRGGMAQVFRGSDRMLGRTVAVKVLDRRFKDDAKFVTRFRREAQAAAGINHPNVVSVFDTGSEDGLHYIVMEYVDGDTLADILAREGPIPSHRAVAIADAVAQALEAAHRKGMVHRDVKPGNIMVDRTGAVKVVDFGIARAAADDTLTQTGTVLGTAAYLSPEQARGETVDPRSDVYSLGCVLYEMLTGRPPFTADSAVAVAYRHVQDDPVPPSSRNPDVSPELEAVVMTALAKDPAARYPSGGAMREALSAAATGEMPTAAVAATEPLQGGDTAVMPPPETAPAPPTSPKGASSWIPWVVIGAMLVALAILIFAALTDEPAQRAGTQGGPPPAEESPSPTAEEPTAVEVAYTELATQLQEGVATGEVSDGAAADILASADEAVAEQADPEAAASSLIEAHEKTQRYLFAEEITSEERAAAIHSAIDGMAAAIGVEAPIPPIEGNGEGENGGDEESQGSRGDSGSSGSSEGKGKAKGHDKNEGKD